MIFGLDCCPITDMSNDNSCFDFLGYSSMCVIVKFTIIPFASAMSVFRLCVRFMSSLEIILFVHHFPFESPVIRNLLSDYIF